MSTARRATCTCQAADPPRLGPRRPLLAASSPPRQDGSTGHRGHRRGRAGAPTLHSVSPAALLSPHQRPARCSATWRRETGTSAQVLCRRGRRWLALLGPGTQCLPADGPGLPWVPEPRGQAGSAPCTSAPGEPLTRSLQPRCPSSVTPSSAHRAAAMSSRDFTRMVEGAPRRPARPGAPQETVSRNARLHTPHGRAAGPRCPDLRSENGSGSTSRTKTPRGPGHRDTTVSSRRMDGAPGPQ